MAHLGSRAFDAIGSKVVSTTATVYENQRGNIEGTYARLVDMMSETEKDAALIEAIKSPDCGWFYRRSASDFTAIPSSPIYYSERNTVAMGFLNSSTTRYLLDIINLTMTKTVGDVGKLPLRQPGEVLRIEQAVKSSTLRKVTGLSEW